MFNEFGSSAAMDAATFVGNGVRNNPRYAYAISTAADKRATAKRIIREAAMSCGYKLTNVQVYQAMRMVLYIRPC